MTDIDKAQRRIVGECWVEFIEATGMFHVLRSALYTRKTVAKFRTQRAADRRCENENSKRGK